MLELQVYLHTWFCLFVGGGVLRIETGFLYHSPGFPGTHSVDQILLHLPPKCCVPPYPMVLLKIFSLNFSDPLSSELFSVLFYLCEQQGTDITSLACTLGPTLLSTPQH